MNVKQLLDLLPFDGLKSTIGAVALILFGIGALITGKAEQGTAIECILAGWTALGLAHKQMKIGETTEATEVQVENIPQA
jgi:hypothetical protein